MNTKNEGGDYGISKGKAVGTNNHIWQCKHSTHKGQTPLGSCSAPKEVPPPPNPSHTLCATRPTMSTHTRRPSREPPVVQQDDDDEEEEEMEEETTGDDGLERPIVPIVNTKNEAGYFGISKGKAVGTDKHIWQCKHWLHGSHTPLGCCSAAKGVNPPPTSLVATVRCSHRKPSPYPHPSLLTHTLGARRHRRFATWR